MYVLLRHPDPSRREGETQSSALSTVGQMVFDLFDSSGFQPGWLEPDLISGQPPDVREAVNAFYFLSNLLDGCCSGDPASRVGVFAFLARDHGGALVAKDGDIRADLGASSLNCAHSAFFLSEDIYQEARDEPGFSFVKMPDMGQIGGEAFYALSVGGGVKNGSFFLESGESMVQTAISPLPAALVHRRHLDDLPEHLLLAIEKQPQAWTLTIGSTFFVISLFFAVMLLRSLHHPSKSVSTVLPAVPVRAVTNPAGANPEAPRTVTPLAADLPVATTSTTPSVKPKPPVREKDAAGQDSAQTVQREKPQRGELLYSQQQIQTLLATADRLSGNGKYDEAIARYRQVLKQDPQNAEALRGLRRATLNKAE